MVKNILYTVFRETVDVLDIYTIRQKTGIKLGFVAGCFSHFIKNDRLKQIYLS